MDIKLNESDFDYEWTAEIFTLRLQEFDSVHLDLTTSDVKDLITVMNRFLELNAQVIIEEGAHNEN